MMGWSLVVVMAASAYGMVFAYNKGGDDRENQMLAHMHISQSEIDRHQQAMEQAVVKAVENIRVENKTYVRNFKEIEKQSVVYRDCKHSDDAVGLLNSALTGNSVSTKPDLPGVLPK